MTLFANESSIVWVGLTGRIGGIAGVYHPEGIVATFRAAPLAAPGPLSGARGLKHRWQAQTIGAGDPF